MVCCASQAGNSLIIAIGDQEAKVIYCVVPRELDEETFQRLVEHYKDNESVTVIRDRRESERRTAGDAYGGERTLRDRRQHGSRARRNI